MSVYFAQAGRFFKIGYSDNAERRFMALHKSGSRYTFPEGVSLDLADRHLYRVIDGDKSREHDIQLALDQFAVGLEWFLDEPPVRAFIDALPTEFSIRRRDVLAEVERDGGWCEDEYRAVQHGRSVREMARHAARSAVA